MSTPTPILQFGTSRFLQAHADLFISEALARGQAVGPVTVVQSSGDPARRARLAALAQGYPVRIEGLENGHPLRRDTHVTSIVRALDSACDWPEIRRIAMTEAEIILSNTGDAGWTPRPADTAPAFDQAMSYPAKLAHLLLARFAAGGRPIQVMPTELVAHNGDRLRERLLDLAPPLGAAFTDWLRREVRFVNSLVDRIVSEPLEPAGAVAEPYALWAIAACPGLLLPCHHPAVQVVPDLEPVQRLKLHVLNLGHSYLVAGWLARGRSGGEHVRDLMQTPVIRADLESLYAEEVIPTFTRCGIPAEAYVAATLDRLANPFLAHRLADIAQNHPEKLARRIAAFLDWSDGLGLPAAQPRLRALLVRPAG